MAKISSVLEEEGKTPNIFFEHRALTGKIQEELDKIDKIQKPEETTLPFFRDDTIIPLPDPNFVLFQAEKVDFSDKECPPAVKQLQFNQ